MSKFNTTSTRPAVHSPITSERTPSGRTFEGGAGYARDTKSELFLLAVANMVGEHTFYETADKRDTRYADLVHRATLEDPDWTARFLRWLRSDGNMRTAALVGAAEFAKARLDAGLPGQSRQVVDSVLQRADEPGEMLAYWTSVHGRTVPKPVKRGVADAVKRLYNERTFLKYDSDSRGFRFGDVLNLTHPDVSAPWQADLYRYALDVRHGHDTEVPDSLSVTRANAHMRRAAAETPEVLLDRWGLHAAGMTWEQALSLAGSKVDKARLWEAMVPSMGYMALLRNLRNFDQAGVSDNVADTVSARLADPEQVAKSRQFPFRFWAAYKHTDSLRWAHALEKAINLSLGNVPRLGGRTLVLVDRSPSMFPGYYWSTPNKSDIPLAEQAALFGAAVALRAEDATLVEFGGQSGKVTVPRGGSVLRLIEQFGRIDGTDIPSAVRAHYANHDRVIVVTDEQTRPGYLPSNMATYGGMSETTIDALIPLDVPVYMWNMAGYKPGAMPSGSRNRHTFGGLTDQAFRMIPLLEAGRNADWPF